MGGSVDGPGGFPRSAISSAMNQPPTIALSEYYGANSSRFKNESLNFCNSFWGPSDAGVDVLFARMQSAAQTIEDLNAFWKERASIEEDYAKRLGQLAEKSLGREEVGDPRKSLDAIRADAECQAKSHLLLAQKLRSEFEILTTAFRSHQLNHKRTSQADVEMLLKTKQNQELYVSKTREIYEQDCERINVMEAQASLVRGTELERMSTILERAEPISLIKERDYSNSSRVLKETVIKWEQEWKSFCDTCQDMEEDRMNFMKNTFFNYVNAVSTVSVATDASSQAMRVSFERMKPEKDVEIFAFIYGTGNEIPDPPNFVRYSAPNGTPSSSAQRTTRRHIAQFMRSAPQDVTSTQNLNDRIPSKERPVANALGIGDEEAAAFRENEPYTSESIVDASPQPTAVSSQAQQVPDTNGIQLTPSMTNQNDGAKRLEGLQASISQRSIRRLPNPPVVDSTVPNAQVADAKFPQASAADHQAAVSREPTSPHSTILASAVSELNEPSQQQMLTGQQQILAAQQQQMLAVQQHQMLVAQQQQLHTLTFQWQQQQEQMLQLSQQLLRMDHPVRRSRSQSRSFPRASSSSNAPFDANPAGGHYPAINEPENIRDVPVTLYEPENIPLIPIMPCETEATSDMSAMPFQKFSGPNLFLEPQHRRNSHLNLNPINFVIKKVMKSRRVAHRAHSTSASSISTRISVHDAPRSSRRVVPANLGT